MILFRDPPRRHLPHRDGDLERRRPDAGGFGKALRIEIAVVVEELTRLRLARLQLCAIMPSAMTECVTGSVTS